MTLRTGEDTVNCRSKLWIALCGGIVLEEALDLSFDRLLMMMMMMIKRIVFRKVRTETILEIHNTSVLPTFLYGSENWTLNSTTKTKN